jgi:hypothetical protein
MGAEEISIEKRILMTKQYRGRMSADSLTSHSKGSLILTFSNPQHALTSYDGEWDPTEQCMYWYTTIVVTVGGAVLSATVFFSE